MDRECCSYPHRGAHFFSQDCYIPYKSQAMTYTRGCTRRTYPPSTVTFELPRVEQNFTNPSNGGAAQVQWWPGGPRDYALFVVRTMATKP